MARLCSLCKLFGSCLLYTYVLSQFNQCIAIRYFQRLCTYYTNSGSIICDKLNINVWELIKLANRHPRVNILKPGPGVGGHCIAVDPWFIVDSAPEEARLIRTARDVNDSKPEFVLNKLEQVAEEFKHPKIALLGLAFKADIDDLRESPAVGIAQKVIQEALGEVFIVEPHITELPAKLQADNVSLVSLAESLEKVNIIVTLTDHTAFKLVKSSVLQEKIIIDARGIWEQD